jgi:3-hydroxybutyryl-CoA dehydrogenase
MRPVGVAGAGTMGAGIAALAAEARLPTLLYDPDPEALARAPENVEPVRDPGALADCGLVIEAAPEDLDLKRNLFARLADVVEPTACWRPTHRRSA